MDNKKNFFDKTGESYRLGNEAEILFKKLIIQKGYKIEDSSKKQNMVDHIDFWVTIDDKQISYEVKGLKKISRSNETTQSNLIWIELQNVQGNLGWVYAPSLDKIAFQNTISSFIIVDRVDLVKLVESKLEHKYVNHPEDALYKLYKRFQRNDLLTLIKREDLLSLPHTILNP